MRTGEFLAAIVALLGVLGAIISKSMTIGIPTVVAGVVLGVILYGTGLLDPGVRPDARCGPRHGREHQGERREGIGGVNMRNLLITIALTFLAACDTERPWPTRIPSSPAPRSSAAITEPTPQPNDKATEGRDEIVARIAVMHHALFPDDWRPEPLDEHQYKIALSEATNLERLLKSNARPSHERFQILLRLGDVFGKITLRTPNREKAALVRRATVKDALSHYDTLLKEAPRFDKNDEVQYRRALLLQLAGRDDEAVAAHQNYLEDFGGAQVVSPWIKNSWYALGELYSGGTTRNDDLAAKAFERNLAFPIWENPFIVEASKRLIEREHVLGATRQIDLHGVPPRQQSTKRLALSVFVVASSVTNSSFAQMRGGDQHGRGSVEQTPTEKTIFERLSCNCGQCPHEPLSTCT